jgi:hypothetical protein
MAEERVERRPTWNDRVFEAIPLAPILVVAGVTLVLLLLFLATVHATGDLAEFARSETRWWQDRDARLVVLMALLAAYIPAARRYEELGSRENLEALRTSISWGPGQFEVASREIQQVDSRSRRVAGLLALLVIPITAFLVDRDPSLYLQRHYWDAAHFWMYGLAGAFCWNAGLLVYAISTHTRCFSRMARGIPEVDLLNLCAFSPFMRQASLFALPGIVVLSFLAFNLADQGFLWAIGILGLAALTWTTVSLLFLMRGVRERIRREKEVEIARVNAAIRGDETALADSAIGARRENLGLGELLAYRSFVESVPEWVIDAPTRARFFLFVAIPLGSWLGGAFVERLLDAILG